jgi:DNA primase
VGDVSVVASFPYAKADGTPFGRADRIEPGRDGARKEFLPYRSDGNGGYLDKPGLNGEKFPLYNAPGVRHAIEAQASVVFVEGEGKCDALQDALISAGSASVVTTVAGGAKARLLPQHLADLNGVKSVIVLPDADEPGRLCARLRADAIMREYPNCDVRIVDLYPADDVSKRDIEDWLIENHSIDELRSLVKATPKHKAPAPTKPLEPAPRTHVDDALDAFVVALVKLLIDTKLVVDANDAKDKLHAAVRRVR